MHTRTLVAASLFFLLVGRVAASPGDDGVRVLLTVDRPPVMGTPGSMSAIVTGPSTITSASLKLVAPPEVSVPSPIALSLRSGPTPVPLAPTVFSTNGAVRFLAVDPATVGVLPSTADPVGAPVTIAVKLRVSVAAANQVRVITTVSNLSGTPVATAETVLPLDAATGPGNSSKRTAAGDVTWRLTASGSGAVPPGIYRFEMHARAEKVAQGGSPSPVGNEASATGQLAVLSTSAPVLAVATFPVSVNAVGLYPVSATLITESSSGMIDRYGDFAFLDARGPVGASLTYADAVASVLQDHVRRVLASVPAGQSATATMLAPMVLGAPGSTVGTSLADDAVAAPFSTSAVTQGTGADPFFSGSVMVTTDPTDRAPAPVAGLRVSIFRANAFTSDDLVATTTTDAAGNYSLPFDNHFGGGNPSFYLFFDSADETFEQDIPDDFATLMAANAGWNIFTALDYKRILADRCSGIWCARSPIFSSIPDTPAKNVFNLAFSGATPIQTIGDLMSGVLQNQRELHLAQEAFYRADGRHDARPPMIVYYPGEFCQTSCFAPANPVAWFSALIDAAASGSLTPIFAAIASGHQWSIQIQVHEPFSRPDGARHEYGHSVMQAALGTGPTLDSINSLLDCSSHDVGERHVKECAFSEGFADWWGLVSKDPPDGLATWIDYEAFDLGHIESPADGQFNEGDVTAGLWDLYDQQDDGPRPDEALGEGDRNSTHPIHVLTVLDGLRHPRDAGTGGLLHSIVHLWDSLRGQFSGSLRIIDDDQERLGAVALKHNYVAVTMPPPLPSGDRAGVPLPTGQPINPLAAITPPVTIDVPILFDQFDVQCDSLCRFGSALARGDLNSDGLIDVVVGAPGAAWEQRTPEGFPIDATRAFTGAALAYLARPNGTFELDVKRSVFGRYTKDADGNLLPGAVSGIGERVALGDVDADGVPDVVTYEHDQVDRVRVRLNRVPPSPLTLEAVGGGATFLITDVAVLDVNADAAPDVIVRGLEVGPSQYGAALLVFFGPLSSDRSAADLVLRPSGSPAILTSTFGHNVALADVDGDGILDLVAGGGGDQAASLGGNAGASVFLGPLRPSPAAQYPSMLLAGPVPMEGLGATSLRRTPGVGLAVAGASFPGITGIDGLLHGMPGLTLYAAGAPAVQVFAFPDNAAGPSPFAPPLKPLLQTVRDVGTLVEGRCSSGTACSDALALGSTEQSPLLREIDFDSQLAIAFLDPIAGGGLSVRAIDVPRPLTNAFEHADFGHDSTALGDINADAFPELAVGSPGEMLSQCIETATCSTGVVWIFSGQDIR